ncbi:MAG: GntR family transcriptional regulator [Burkholderiaceae bacterium]
MAAREAITGPHESLADTVYARVKHDIAEFRLVPGDRFTEGEIATRLGVSRTPVRQALFRLQREGFVQVQFRAGWLVQPFDFEEFENLYDLRIVLETTAVQRLCEAALGRIDRTRLESLQAFWSVPRAERRTDGRLVSRRDEEFHSTLVAAAGNPEIERVHRDVTDRIRIVRRLDFTQDERVHSTYDEHAEILRAVVRRRADQAVLLLKAHIEASKAEVRKLTLHNLYLARRKPRDPARAQARAQRPT